MSTANVNVTVISGNLTQDPELRHTGNGTPVCRLRVAVNSRRKVNGEWVDKPNYFNVIVWGKHGETCNQYLEKGRPVTVEGRLDWREYEAKGGGKREAIEIIADTVQFGPKKQDGSGADAGGGAEKTAANNGQHEMGAGAAAPEEPEGAGEAKEEEEIPF
jgi:single-strand DNA-binding protein